MTRNVVLDSTPLALLAMRRGIRAADEAHAWLEAHLARGTSVLVPEMCDYELRRELLRLGNRHAIDRIDRFINAVAGRYVPVTTASLRLAAQLWADARARGAPTADPHALDIDVILAAQVLTLNLPSASFVVATGNLGHLSRFVPAADWKSA